jgi:hypothetical protein
MTFLKVVSVLFALSRSRNLETRVFSSPAVTSTSDTTQKYNGLLSWLQTQNAEITNKIRIEESSRGGGYGAVVTEDVSEDELLFSIPRTACVTMQNVLEDAKCGKAFQALIQKAGPGGNTVCMAGFLAKEYLMLQEDLKKGKQDSSCFGPYLATLPWQRGVNNQEHTLYWSDEDVETFLKGSLCYNEATELRQEVDLATQVLEGIVGPSIREYRGEKVESKSEFSWPWERNKEQPDLEPVQGFKGAVTGAFVTILTRSFQDGDDDGEKLVPMLDMLQHSDDPNIRHVMRSMDGTVEVRARRDLIAGDELLNQYRSEEEETMPYNRFFTRYGFVPGINEPMQDVLRDRSPIFFSQKVEV